MKQSDGSLLAPPLDRDGVGVAKEISTTSQVLKEPQDPRERKTVGRLLFCFLFFFKGNLPLSTRRFRHLVSAPNNLENSG